MSPRPGASGRVTMRFESERSANSSWRVISRYAKRTPSPIRHKAMIRNPISARRRNADASWRVSFRGLRRPATVGVSRIADAQTAAQIVEREEDERPQHHADQRRQPEPRRAHRIPGKTAHHDHDDALVEQQREHRERLLPHGEKP